MLGHRKVPSVTGPSELIAGWIPLRLPGCLWERASEAKPTPRRDRSGDRAPVAPGALRPPARARRAICLRRLWPVLPAWSPPSLGAA